MYDAIDPKVKAALNTNTSIKMAGAVSHDDARNLAHEMFCDADFIRSMRKGEFATYVRELTPRAVRLKVPFGILEQAPCMSPADHQKLRERNRARYGSSGHSSTTSAAPPSPVEKIPPVEQIQEPLRKNTEWSSDHGEADGS